VPRRRIYYAEFRRTLEAEAPKPVYLFTGAENFLKEEGIQAVVDKALPLSDRSLNLESLYAGSEVSGREVKDRSQTLPFISSARVLIVRQTEKWKHTDLEDLADYFDAPSPSTVLILSSQEEKLKNAAWTHFAEKTYHVECYPLFDNQVPDWVERRSRDHGKQIQREAVRTLIARVGQSLADLDNELVKLASYVSPRDQITEADVRALAGHTRQDSLQDLNAALGRRHVQRALELAEKVLDEGLSAPQVLGAIAWHFRRLQADRTRLEQGETWEQILAAVRSPQAKREMTEQLRAYADQDFPGVFRELLRLDESIKSGKSHWELALLLAILRICAPPRQTVRS
jgi:DNA polymerase III subunit delta